MQDLLVGQLFYDTNNTPTPGKLFPGNTYQWADNPRLQTKFLAQGHDFIIDNGDGTFELVDHSDFIRSGVADIGTFVGNTTAVNGLAGTVLGAGLIDNNRSTGGTASAVRTGQTRSVEFTGDAETAPDHRRAFYGIYGDFTS